MVSQTDLIYVRFRTLGVWQTATEKAIEPKPPGRVRSSDPPAKGRIISKKMVQR